ncbi:ATP-binding protein [Citromicrobium bathyomarinum]|uniref:ATP-binding protein n=1 Tax=Citromicrobium bathyomarinum TaxID=72174 RepID=UPI00315B24A9
MQQKQSNERAATGQDKVPPRLLRDLAILALGYLAAGYLGIWLAVPPGYATIIWPASGVALCALLIRGDRLWPGIWLGSFFLNIRTVFEGPFDFQQELPVLAVGVAIAFGASLQAVVGFRIARRFADGIELANSREIFRLVLLVVLLPCIIASTIGVSALMLAGTVDPSMALRNWLTWYAGDLLGVILVTPILLLSSWSPVAVRWRGQSLQGAGSLVATSLVATLLLTFYAWQFMSEREYRQAEANLAMLAKNTDNALRHRLQIYQRALAGGAAFANVEGDITPAEWGDYVTHLDLVRAYPGMHGFGMFEEVNGEDMPAFREQLAREYGNRIQVHPDVPRDRHFVINRIEPLATNFEAVGLDLAFEEGRREAIALSTKSESAVLTRPIVLVQDQREGPGFLLMRPVLDGAGLPTGRWVYSPMVAEDLLSDLTPSQGTDFALEVFHGEASDPAARLYVTGEKAENPAFALENTIWLAGQPFTLRWSSLRPFERRSVSSAPALALASGLIITLLLGILLTIFQRRESHIMREVDEATAELAEHNRMLELAEATAHIGHWHYDLQAHEVRWSDEVYRLHGLRPGNTPAIEKAIEFYHPDDREMVEQSMAAAAETCEPYRFRARLLSATGDLRHVEVRGRVDTDESGEATAIIGVIIDRTDETAMRERLTETIAEARAADRAKSSFLANMSHEIRTPMNGVIGFTELALAEEKEPEQKRRLQMIADSSNAMLRLLNDLLDFAKIEAKQMAIVNELTDLRHTLQSCVRLMEPVASNQGLRLSLDVDPAVPARMLVDKMRLRQIILNLVGNALKFTEEGEVKISASISRRQTDQSGMIFITVRDTGIGIPEDRLESIFGKFTQADDTTARRYGGTGLGLPISAELAELMGGKLRVESKPGVGSTFILTLPLEKSEGVAVPLRDAEEPTPGHDHPARLNFLIAEDNPINQELTIAMVDKAGHDCTLVQNGRQAVDAVLQASSDGAPYDMVLMDMQMPEMDGLEASREIRKAGIDAKTLPILAVTANAYSDDVQRCLAAGMQAHLTKPLRLDELYEAISQWSPHPAASAEPSAGMSGTGTNPRLRAMFDERVASIVTAIDAAVSDGSLSEEKKRTITGLLHQTAGVAGYFEQQALGEFCREMERKLLDTTDQALMLSMLETIRERLTLATTDG